MALTDAADIQTISNALGLADTALQANLDLTNGASSSSYMKTARETVRTDATDATIDNGLTLLTAMRKTETGLASAVATTLVGSCKALDAFSIAQTGAKLRISFKTGVTWSNAFCALWRRAMSEEMIVRIGVVTDASGTWALTDPSSVAIVLDSALEIRIPATIGSAAITANFVLLKASSVSELVSITIPAGTVGGTVIPIKGGSGKWQSVSSVGVTGGTSGDVFEVWVAA
jgi:hypothetical protein